MRTACTPVAIIGAGPAGLMLANLLRRAGIESVVLEARSRGYCETRVRAGLLERGSVDLMDEIECGARLHRESLEHGGIALRFGGRSHRIDIAGTTGKSMFIYGQQEAVKDLIALHLSAGGEIRFEVSDVLLEGIDGDAPAVRFTDADGTPSRLTCDFIAGCDGFHGVARGTIPPDAIETYERDYPFAWLGLLVDAPPADPELIYVHHPDGFALFTMRSPTVSRLYLQVEPTDVVERWSDDRAWTELHRRLEGDDVPYLPTGAVLQKGITQMRSFVAAPMRYHRLFLAGDAAHIVPPTGAKGMNLALSDVATLATAFQHYYRTGSSAFLDEYSDVALRRVWAAERFSWWMTSLLHVFHGRSPFDDRIQLSELDYVATSSAGARMLAEQYAGMPIERFEARSALTRSG